MDKPDNLIEEQLNNFMVGIAKASIRAKLFREYQENQEREREEWWKREAYLRELREQEECRIEHLGQLLNAWNRANQLRIFLNQAKQLPQNLSNDHFSREEWLVWLENYINHIDPLTQKASADTIEPMPVEALFVR